MIHLKINIGFINIIEILHVYLINMIIINSIGLLYEIIQKYILFSASNKIAPILPRWMRVLLISNKTFDLVNLKMNFL
jgi:hypothetical protein